MGISQKKANETQWDVTSDKLGWLLFKSYKMISISERLSTVLMTMLIGTVITKNCIGNFQKK